MKKFFTKLLKVLKKPKNLFLIFIACFTIYAVYDSLSSSMGVIFGVDTEEVKEISYNEFLGLVKNGDVDTIYYSTSNEHMTVTLFNEETRNMSKKERDEYTYKNADKRLVLYPASEDFRERMLKAGVNMKIQSSGLTFFDIFNLIFSFGLPILYICVLIKVFRGGNKKLTENSLIQHSDVTFKDVIGHDEVLEDVKFITELIKHPERGASIGARVPKGILFSGSPGTGKTLIAKAIAGEANVPFIYMNASSMVEIYVGMGAKRVRELFEVAKKNAPCILFIDEIDAVGVKRSNYGGHSENDQTLLALLQEMDGFTGREGIFIIAATNRADKLDKALIRPGRFDRQIIIEPPSDWNIRLDLFKHYLAKYSVSDDVDAVSLSKQTVGFTGADIEAMCNEAGLIAMMKQVNAINMSCMEEALDKQLFKGNRKAKDKLDEDRKIVAYHEAGHAVMTFLCGQDVARASIISTTSGVGGAVHGEDDGHKLQTKQKLEDRVKICYAGRACEDIKFGEITTGASNDITQATAVLKTYVAKVGFDDSLGLIDIGVLEDADELQGKISSRVIELSKKYYDETLDILKDNFDKVERVAQALLEHETLAGNTIKELLED